MTPDSPAAVYAFVRATLATQRLAPDAKAAYVALGCTKREYYAALRLLLRYGFLQRGARAEWRYATLHIRRCPCGAEITPENASFVTARGRTYLRRDCAACENARATERKREWRAQNPRYDAVQQRRIRRQQQAAQRRVSA